MIRRGALAAMVFASACGTAPVPGWVRVSLRSDADVCQEYCIDTFGAQIYDEHGTSALGPPREVACGTDIVFLDLPAGTRVRARAWVSTGATRRLEGEAGPVTVVAGETTPVAVALKALQTPVVTSVSPEPAWPGDSLTLSGSGLGEGGGLHGVELDGRSLDILSWSEDTVVASLHPDDDGGLLTVRECGVSSSAVPVRVLVDTPGRSSLSPLGCAGMTLTGATAITGSTDMVLAFACDDPAEGYLQRYEPADCAPFGVPARLPAGPSAIAPSRTNPEVFVALRNGPELFRVPVPLPSTPAGPFAVAPDAPGVTALAATSTALFALTAAPGPRIIRVPLAGPGGPEAVLSDLTPVAIAASPSRLFAAGTSPGGGEPVIAIVSDANPRLDVRLPGCWEPSAIAASSDDARVAVACSGEETTVIGIVLGSFQVVTERLDVSARWSALAMDRTGDGAIAWDPDSGTLAAASIGPARWHRVWDLGDWTPGGPLARHPSQDDYLVAGPGPGEITVVSPYSRSGPCTGRTD